MKTITPTLVLGATAFTLVCLTFVAAQTIDWGFCKRREDQVMQWDQCNQIGQFKSVSVCFWSNRSSTFITRYDFYQCIQLGASRILVPGNCSGALSPVMSNDSFIDVFNRYNAATRRCDLTPPATPSPPTMPTTMPPDSNMTLFGEDIDYEEEMEGLE